MIFRLDDLKNVCNIILSAVDLNSPTLTRDMLELKSESNKLHMYITNKEYYVEFILPLNKEENFHATVNAQIFLKLLSKITTDVVEFKIKDNSLIIVGNGTYKLPMIFNDDSLMELPKIEIDNETLKFDIEGNKLYSITKFNVKQQSTGYITDNVQKLVFVDENGALTFTSTACANKFSLEKPVKMFLDAKLVKMFSLFKNKEVHFSMGFDTLSGNIVQQKVRFDIGDIIITAILPQEDTFNKPFKAKEIRALVNKKYDYSIVFNRVDLTQILGRLSLLSDDTMMCNIDFKTECVEVFDTSCNSSEKLYYNNEVDFKSSYESAVNISTLKSMLDCFSDQYLTLSFGDGNAYILSSGNVYMVIPEGNRKS